MAHMWTFAVYQVIHFTRQMGGGVWNHSLLKHPRIDEKTRSFVLSKFALRLHLPGVQLQLAICLFHVH